LVLSSVSLIVSIADDQRGGKVGEVASEVKPLPGVGTRLGYLLKHGHLEIEALNDAALAPFGIDSRELGILLSIADLGAASQQQVAERLGIDRTTMVARIDALEVKGIVSRQPDPDDRRRNLVTLTDSGRDTVTAATEASNQAERDFLSGLSLAEVKQLRDLLVRVMHRSS
jgi:DNA-binding MarR family transcriptional regulator